MKKKLTVKQLFITPLIIVVLLQGLVPLTALFGSNVKTTLENRTIGMYNHTVENRARVIQNAMNSQKELVNGEEKLINSKLNLYFAEKNMTIDDFIADSERQEEFLSLLFPRLITTLQNSTVDGLFIVLDNGTDKNSDSEYNGVYLRDLDNSINNADNSDLLLKKGNKKLTEEECIILDEEWSQTFRIEGKDVRTADDYFYKPYLAAKESGSLIPQFLGYWSRPFVMENSPFDYHKMITYSYPLIYGGSVYGVVGVEISTEELLSFFPVSELDPELMAGYLLTIQTEDESYDEISGAGSLYDIVVADQNIRLGEFPQYLNLYQVHNKKIGNQSIYAIPHKLGIYSSGSPFTNEKWVLIGLIPGDAIFYMGNHLYSSIFWTIVICALIGMIIMLIVVKFLTKPVYSLEKSVDGGLEGLRLFKKSGIKEIDDMHEAIKNLAEAEINTSEMLREEKERYRIAVESSQDIFFTHNISTGQYELVDSKGITTGEYEKNMEHLFSMFHPEDVVKFKRIMRAGEERFATEIRMINSKTGDYRWVLFSGRIIGTNDENKKVVGFVRDINEAKVAELKNLNSRMMDPVTSFFRRNAGINEIERDRDNNGYGCFVAIKISQMSEINRTNGMITGDVLMEGFSKRLKGLFFGASGRKDIIFVRFAPAIVIMWIPDTDCIPVCHWYEGFRNKFNSVIHHGPSDPGFCTVIFKATNDMTTQSALKGLFGALETVDAGDYCCIDSTKDSYVEGEIPEYVPVLSNISPETMHIGSLALGLFERNLNSFHVLDLLFMRLTHLYNVANLIITSYRRDYLRAGLKYSYYPVNDLIEGENNIECREEEYQQLLFLSKQGGLQKVDEDLLAFDVFKDFNLSENDYIFHMSDIGMYTGSIIFINAVPDKEFDEELRNSLLELCSVIQNRFNQDNHDISAKAKADFLARMSHEIRTPMNAIIGMTEIALKPEQSEERRIDCLNKVKNASNYLLGLLNDVLDMSKIESGKMQLVLNDFWLDKSIDDSISLLEPKAMEKNHTLNKDIRLIHTCYYGDELRLSQVVVNLVSNAIKYTEDGGNITLRVVETPIDDVKSELLFEVIDDGIGIEKENQQRVFGSFEQIEESKIRQQGTGLGLAICSRIVHMMDSNILLESEVGKGSRFYFTVVLPYGKSVEESNISVATSRADLRGRRLLMAEDNELNAEIAIEILNEAGYVVEHALDGQICVDMLKNSPDGYYDLVLMDIQMPNLNGYEATRAIRNLKDAKADIPIVAMTANAFEEDKREAFAAGMNGHLGKPIVVADLLALIESLIS